MLILLLFLQYIQYKLILHVHTNMHTPSHAHTHEHKQIKPSTHTHTHLCTCPSHMHSRTAPQTPGTQQHTHTHTHVHHDSQDSTPCQFRASLLMWSTCFTDLLNLAISPTVKSAACKDEAKRACVGRAKHSSSPVRSGTCRGQCRRDCQRNVAEMESFAAP